MKPKLPFFKKGFVLVVGDIILDRYWYGLNTRVSPESPVLIMKVDVVEERLGGAANVAVNIAALGTKSHLIGLIGEDNTSSVLSDMLNKANVNYDFIKLKNYSTVEKLRIISRNQQLIRLDFENCFESFDSNLIEKPIRKLLPLVDVLVLSDYAKGTLNKIQNIIQLAQKIDVPVLIDPKSNDFNRYRGATLLTPNFFEFERVVGKCNSEEEIRDRGMRVLLDYELSALLVTRSEKGMILFQVDKKPLYFSAHAKEVYDVTGAGDTVIGVLAASLAAGVNLEDACFFANFAAGLVVQKIGTSMVTLSELENAVYASSEFFFGVVDEFQLKKAISISRARGEKIVMTNGVFDILHAGHIRYLENARKLGSRLIVAVNSDASTRRLKGKNRPINSQMARMVILSALKAVDWVICFDEDTPRRLISEILPDFLVKGSDYQPEDIAGNLEVLENGGIVRVIDFQDNISTTKIIDFIKKI